MRLPVPQLWVIVLSSDNDTEGNGLGGVEEGIGFQVDTSIARSLDVADVRRELRWVTPVMVPAELLDQLLQSDYLCPELRQG